MERSHRSANIWWRKLVFPSMTPHRMCGNSLLWHLGTDPDSLRPYPLWRYESLFSDHRRLGFRVCHLRFLSGRAAVKLPKGRRFSKPHGSRSAWVVSRELSCPGNPDIIGRPYGRRISSIIRCAARQCPNTMNKPGYLLGGPDGRVGRPPGVYHQTPGS